MSRTACAAYDIIVGSRPTTVAMIESSVGSLDATGSGAVFAAIAGAMIDAAMHAKNASRSSRRVRRPRVAKIGFII
jgi:hypothetical protein